MSSIRYVVFWPASTTESLLPTWYSASAYEFQVIEHPGLVVHWTGWSTQGRSTLAVIPAVGSNSTRL